VQGAAFISLLVSICLSLGSTQIATLGFGGPIGGSCLSLEAQKSSRQLISPHPPRIHFTYVAGWRCSGHANYPFFDNFMNPFEHHDGLSFKAADPFDRTWIESLTSVGDSYAAGLGAGHAVKAGNQVSSSMSAFYNHSTNQFFASWRSIQTVTNTAMAILTWST